MFNAISVIFRRPSSSLRLSIYRVRRANPKQLPTSSGTREFMGLLVPATRTEVAAVSRLDPGAWVLVWYRDFSSRYPFLAEYKSRFNGPISVSLGRLVATYVSHIETTTTFQLPPPPRLSIYNRANLNPPPTSLLRSTCYQYRYSRDVTV
ncbi:hypothetical protein Hypma_002280 [Hypsizygus marmoreus]|uniref:Uncharacterized protein n=1 Tax=Hypsizygus marmoreus TaxID=39966 RepID=A0A369K2L4_HYPMA|nr:hypothetical protein Hypma_002280 [Hypsizygus marmoreus]